MSIVKKIGKAKSGSYRQGLPLDEKIAQERRIMLKEVGKVVIPTTDFCLLDKIERLLLRWWLLNIPGSEECVDFLRNFPHFPEYILFKWFTPKNYLALRHLLWECLSAQKCRAGSSPEISGFT